MKNFLKGFIVGIGKIIPGVSGAVLAISMGIYDRSVYYICNFKSNKNESIKYLFPIGLGVMLSVIFFSKAILFSLSKFYLITMLFFVGLIIGSVPMIMIKVKKNDYFIVIISFIIFFLISISNIDNLYIVKNNFIDFIMLFSSGIAEAIGTVVPGISSTALLMILGTYNNVMGAIGNFENIKLLIPFILGLCIGIFVCVKIINYLFSKYENKVYAFVLGVLLSSVVLLVIQSFKHRFGVLEFIIGILFMVGGIFISSLFKEK